MDWEQELSRDLWRLKVCLRNHHLDTVRELTERGLPLTSMSRWDEHFTGFPALDCQKRIFEQVTRLWERREEIKIQFLQLPPLEAHFHPDRFKEQVTILLQDYVTEHTNIFRLASATENASDSAEEGPDDWNPMLTKDQVLIFLELAECLTKQSTTPTFVPKSKQDIFRGLLLYEDFDVLCCTMSFLFNKDSLPEQDSSK